MMVQSLVNIVQCLWILISVQCCGRWAYGLWLMAYGLWFMVWGVLFSD